VRPPNHHHPRLLSLSLSPLSLSPSIGLTPSLSLYLSIHTHHLLVFTATSRRVFGLPFSIHTGPTARVYRRFIIQRGHEHTRSGNLSESGFGSLLPAGGNFSGPLSLFTPDHLLVFTATSRRDFGLIPLSIHTRPSAWEVARTAVAPPSSVVKCLWEVFVWGCGMLFLSCACVCVGGGGVVLCVGVCV